MNDKLLIFSHYYSDSTIADRFSYLKSLNKDWDIVSAGFKSHEQNLLPNSLVIDTTNYPNNNSVLVAKPDANINWTQGDIFLYDIYTRFPNYKKYFLFEYDTIFNCSIDYFFPNLYKYNHFGSNVFNTLNESWIFIDIYLKNNQYHLPLDRLASIGQTSCIYIDNSLLSLVVSELEYNKKYYDHMFSELRLGSLIKKFVPKLLPARDDIAKFINWDMQNININLSLDNYFYHPYK